MGSQPRVVPLDPVNLCSPTGLGMCGLVITHQIHPDFSLPLQEDLTCMSLTVQRAAWIFRLLDRVAAP